MNKRISNLIVYGLLLLLGISTLSTAIYFVPGEVDDLTMLSFVANIPSPINFFSGDCGLCYNNYRPIHFFILWLFYHVFGVSAIFNQLFNLILHFTIVFLFVRLIRRVQPDNTISFLLGALLLVSIYTLSPATWVPDRATLFVALFFLLLLDHLYKGGQPNIGRFSYIIILSILALMSKESGLIVPLFVMYYATNIKLPVNYRVKVISSSLIIILAYSVFRVSVFGNYAFDDMSGNLISKIIRYGDWSTLAKQLILYRSYLENVIQNLIAPFLPIFNVEGGLLPINKLIITSPIWFLTLLLVLMTTQRKLSTFQKVALVIIILNSIIHYYEFRYRTQYLSQLGICLYMASAPLRSSSIYQKTAFKVLGSVLLLLMVILINRNLNLDLLRRYKMLNMNDVDHIVQLYPSGINRQIVIKVLEKYKK
jgi:hypothetical protein